MWRRHLTIGLMTVIAGIWFASWEAHTPYLSLLSRYQEGDDYQALVRANLREHLKNHHNLIVREGAIEIAPLQDAFIEMGQRYLAVFSARPESRKQQFPDLYVMQVNMGQNAYPLAFTPPRNITNNPLSDDHLFGLSLSLAADRQGAQILFGQRDAQGSCRSVTHLWWSDGEDGSERSFSVDLLSTWLTTWENAHYFDRKSAPDWRILRFAEPLARCEASLGIKGDKSRGESRFQVFSDKQLAFTVDTMTKSIAPMQSGVELLSPQSEDESSTSSFQNNLRIYDLLTLDEDLKLSALSAELLTSFEKNIYELIVSGDSAFLPVSKVSSILDSRRPTWYPPRIDVTSGLPGEGSWRPLRVEPNAEPLILKTFIRLDPEHPYHMIHLYALDMRRLGLKFVAGADLKATHFEGVGSSRINQRDLPQVIAAFSGGPLNQELVGREGGALHLPHGIVETGHVLAPLSEGAPTITLDARGRIALGRLDVGELPSEWVSARQSYAPLVDLRMSDRNFVPPQSPKGRLDALHITRSAIGINQQGTLIYAWSEATTSQYLAQALKLVGVKFAMSLRTHTRQHGMAIYPNPSLGGELGRERSAHPKMEVDPKVWRDGARDDFFYVVRAQSLPKTFPRRSVTWARGEGEWRPIQHQDIDPWLATSFLSAKQAGSQVDLLRIDGERLRINLALGGHRDARYLEEERPLAAQPVARIPIGFSTRALGVMMLGERRHQVQPGKMTWGVDDQGRSVIDRWGQGEMTSDKSWRDYLQGDAIIEGGLAISPTIKPSVGDSGSPPRGGAQPSGRADALSAAPSLEVALPVEAEPFHGGPITALGITQSGDLIFAQCATSNLKAVQTAMVAAGVERALRLNYQGTAETGASQFFYNHEGQTFYNAYPDLALRPAFLQTPNSALISLEDSLILTTRASNPRARFIESFRDLVQAP